MLFADFQFPLGCFGSYFKLLRQQLKRDETDTKRVRAAKPHSPAPNVLRPCLL